MIERGKPSRLEVYPERLVDAGDIVIHPLPEPLQTASEGKVSKLAHQIHVLFIPPLHGDVIYRIIM